MIKRLEQVVALVVAAGLAIVSYWLFFSWAQGGGAERGRQPRQSLRLPSTIASTTKSAVSASSALRQVSGSEAAAGLEHPLLSGAVVEARQVGAHLLGRHG